MALQTSGAISLLDLQNEFGGSNPISISEYYRGGGLVPATTTTSTTTYEPGPGTSNYYYSLSSPLYGWAEQESYPYTVTIYWNNTAITSFNQSYPGELSQDTYGGWTYFRFSSPTDTNVLNGGVYYSIYQIRRQQTTTTTTDINTGVPTSGTISLNDFYGAIS